MGTYEGKTVNVTYLDSLDNTYTAVATDDLIQGYGGADTINGNGRDNYIFGDQRRDPPNYDATDFDAVADGADLLYGFGGDDTLNPGSGSGNYVAGGIGSDFLDYRYATPGEAVVVDIAAGTATAGTYGSTTFIEIENVMGSQNGPNDISGDENDNELHGGAFDDLLKGRDGKDTLLGFAGHDDLRGGTGGDLIKGGDGNDRIFGGKGSDRLIGGQGGDKISGDKGNDTLLGANGKDRLLGKEGNDKLFGQVGQDVLIGGTGSDTMTGGSGGDTFVFYHTSGSDKITDFESNDTIRIASGANRYSQLDFTDTNSGLRIEFGSVEIFLKGLDLGDIDASNFDFV